MRNHLNFLIYSFLNFNVMAKFDSYLLGKVTKTLSNVTMCYMNKQNIARARIFSRKDKPTSEMLDQRARMKVLIKFVPFLVAGCAAEKDSWELGTGGFKCFRREKT